MAPIRYSLHYEDYSEHLMSRFGKLLQTQSLVDMTLMCSSHTLRVHKTVLAASSAYFQDVLQKQTGEPLIILKMRFSVLKCLVEFMYCGKTQCLEENLDELVSAAQFLKIKGLSKVTKEGLGIENHSELPVFTPPVVINRPPQSLIDLHSQDNVDPKLTPQQLVASSNQPSSENRQNKDMVVRIPFDIDGGAVNSGDYSDPTRSIKPRRGRPSYRRSGGWDGAGAFGRATERALLRREQDSRKAIHQLKHLQTRHMQDYMDRVTLSQAVNSICDSESSSHNYMNIDNDLIYMDQTVSSNVLDPTIPFSKEHSIGNETITSNYSSVTNPANDGSNSGIGTAMSQYVNALKSAGLPTDLPILFESGDGSYINVNEQVLLDMVQSSEIQYEVIEQPNIMEKVADPSEIKSIDDLSKSIERGEMLMSSKNYSSSSNYSKHNSAHEDAINSLNEILPDNLDSYPEQQNYVVLDHELPGNSNHIDQDSTSDFACLESDMQFFTKSMSDDVKKYYEEQQLNEVREIERLCPTNTSLDTSFNISLLDTKNGHLGDPVTQQYGSINPENLRRNEDCYDFTSQSPNPNEFKDETLDYLISTPKQSGNETNYDDDVLTKRSQERDEILKDLMNIESDISMENSNNSDQTKLEPETHPNFDASALHTLTTDNSQMNDEKNNLSESASPGATDLLWDTNNRREDDYSHKNEHQELNAESTILQPSLTERINLLEPEKNSSQWNILDPVDIEKENINKDIGKENIDTEASTNINNTLNEDIPFAVGLLPLKQIQATDAMSQTKRKKSINDDLLDNVDSKYLKRKVKYKKL